VRTKPEIKKLSNQAFIEGDAHPRASDRRRHVGGAFRTLMSLCRGVSDTKLLVEVNGHYSKHFEALKALVDSAAA
jgi:hypothetical protein